MPQFLENILSKAGRAKGFKGKHLDRYVYGALNRMGAMRGSKITAKGRRMEAKHARDTRGGAAASALKERYPD